ncbi:MAG: MBL fold metallo-hydrolase [Hyphomicrobium sp.]
MKQNTGLKAAIIPVTPFQQNCTLLWNQETGQGAVVDPGGDLEQITSAIKEVGIKPEKILLTHGHIDHAGAAEDLRLQLNIKIEGPHKEDHILLDNLYEQGLSYGIPAKNVRPDRWLQEGDTTTVGGYVFHILHCPGHSPGSVVFVNREHKFMLSGDVLFKGSIGRTEFPYGDHHTLISGIKTKLFSLGDEYTFICGHGPSSTIGEERKSNPFLV